MIANGSTTMFRNYLKIAWRALRKNKAFAAINIVGLAVGMATCLLIVLFVRHELSYDRYHSKADRIVRVTIKGRIGDNETNMAGIGAPAGPALLRDYPGVESFTRFYEQGTFIVKRGTNQFKEERIIFTDSTFFDTFSIPLLTSRAGTNPKNVLTEPNTVVLTENMARKYFGSQNPIGQTLMLGMGGLYRVTGVCQNVPDNTHFHYDFFASMRSIQLGDKWLTNGMKTYLVLREGYSTNELQAQAQVMVQRYVAPEIKLFTGVTLAEFLQKGNRFDLYFQPLTDIHLRSNLEGEAEPNSDIKYVYIFSLIALFILLIACINFMNLSTAGSVGRAKEVGVRKVLGSGQRQLIRQFLTESMVMVLLALLVAVGLVGLLLPLFNQLAGKSIGPGAITDGWMLPGIALSCLLTGLLAGGYPAFFLASFKPIRVLKGGDVVGKQSGGQHTNWVRNTLVTVQFVVSSVLIVGTVIVYQQLRFIQTKKVGFDKEQVLVLHDTYMLGEGIQAFKTELTKLAAVRQVTLAGFLPVGASNKGTEGFQPANGSPQPETYRATTYQVDADYLPTLGMKLVRGRNFSNAFRSDSTAVLINETAAKQFGWKNPIGQQISTVAESALGRRTYTIVGVVNDFHFESMHQSIAPLVMRYGGDTYQIALRVQSSDISALLTVIEKRWKTRTGSPFAYSFLNERFNTVYASENRIGKLFGIFALLAILIACMGLFGLAAFTTQQRTKEIGVRKVLGASVTSIVGLLSKDFLKLVLIAIVIASPLAWWAMNRWLADFAYKIDIEWWVFALAGLLAVGIALMTVSFQSVKAALMNPVSSLRSE